MFSGQVLPVVPNRVEHGSQPEEDAEDESDDGEHAQQCETVEDAVQDEADPFAPEHEVQRWDEYCAENHRFSFCLLLGLAPQAVNVSVRAKYYLAMYC